MQRLAELPLAAVVVERRYSALYKLEHVDGSWLADQLTRLEVRYPEIHLVFADSRRFAEEWNLPLPHHRTDRHIQREPKRLRHLSINWGQTICPGPERIRISDPYTHRVLKLQPPQPNTPEPLPPVGKICRRDRLGGLIHEYCRTAA